MGMVQREMVFPSLLSDQHHDSTPSDSFLSLFFALTIIPPISTLPQLFIQSGSDILQVWIIYQDYYVGKYINSDGSFTKDDLQEWKRFLGS